MTLLFSIDPFHPAEEAIDRAVDTLQQGKILAYPTETLYGLGVDPFQETAMESLYNLKGRPAQMPVSLLVKDVAMLETLVQEISLPARRLIESFLPGPFTIVLFARANLPRRLTAGTGKIGLRISSYPLLPHLFSRYSAPMTTTSANPRGKPAAREPHEILAHFPEGLACLLDAGPVPGGVGSTVVDATGTQPVILREGTLCAEEIVAVWTS